MTAPDDFLLEDYRLKVAFLTAQFDRMWTRFNFMIAIESALLAAAASIASHATVKWILWAEVLVSAVWYVFGAQDKYLVEVYRCEVKAAAQALKTRYSLPDTHPYVGQVDVRQIPELMVKRNPLQWRFTYASVTHLAALFPILAFVIWLAAALTVTLSR